METSPPSNDVILPQPSLSAIWRQRRSLVLTLLVSFVTVWIFLYWAVMVLLPRDTTDPPGGRSGISLYVDSLTGCHYLGTLFGGLTPRLDAEGEQICTGQEVAP